MASITPKDGAFSSSSSKWTNHVFLSFRGEDTRQGFTDHLFASLERRGIKTFKDDHDLQRGEVISVELNKAIEESMFAIIILSPNYASSTWCLDELQKIVECSRCFGQAVFPLFYGVDPSDVRHQRGSFDEAFRKHEEKFRKDRNKIEMWRDSLREVASYSGWDSKGWLVKEYLCLLSFYLEFPKYEMIITCFLYRSVALFTYCLFMQEGGIIGGNNC